MNPKTRGQMNALKEYGMAGCFSTMLKADIEQPVTADALFATWVEAASDERENRSPGRNSRCSGRPPPASKRNQTYKTIKNQTLINIYKFNN